MPARTQRRLRLAYVTETYPPDVNGVAMTVASMVAGLRGRGHRVQLVRLRPHDPASGAASPEADDVLLPGLPVPLYPGLRMGTPCKGRLIDAWTRQRPDVVHIATEGPLGWSALSAARSLGLPVTSEFRTNFHAYSAHYGAGWLNWTILAYLRRFPLDVLKLDRSFVLQQDENDHNFDFIIPFLINDYKHAGLQKSKQNHK